MASDDAWRRVKPFKPVVAPLIRYLSDDEIRRLLNACQGAFRDLVHAALLTGCRYGELCRLKVADYNADVETLTIREAKSGQRRHVTLTGEAPELINQLVAGRASGDVIFKRGDSKAWKRAEQLRPMRQACQRAGIVPGSGFPCATPYPRLDPGDARRANGSYCPAARACRHSATMRISHPITLPIRSGRISPG